MVESNDIVLHTEGREAISKYAVSELTALSCIDTTNPTFGGRWNGEIGDSRPSKPVQEVSTCW